MSADRNEQITESIAGRLAVVTGAVGGIGRAIAARLAEAGCRLALVDLNQERLDELIRAMRLSDAAAYATDISDRAQVERMAAEVERRFGQVQILVNAAGVNTKQRTLADISAQQWEEVVAVNLNGAFHCLQALLPLMRNSGGAVVVNIVSTAARFTSPGAGVAYCASKRGLLSLTESINIEQGRYGIRACALLPGEVDTPLIDARPTPVSPERRAAMLRPEDIAEAVHYLLTRPSRVTVTELLILPTSQAAGVHVP